MTYKQVRCILFGSRSVGKSTFATKFEKGLFVENVDPDNANHSLTLEHDPYRKILHRGEEEIFLEITDTTSFGFKAAESLYYKAVQIPIIVFSVTSIESFNNISKFISDLLSEKGVDWWPWILVATKCDLENERVVTSDQAIQFAGSLKASAYVEVSSKTGINVNEAFDVAVDVYREYGEALLLKKKKEHLGAKKVLPWNWSKMYKWDKELKSLQGLTDVYRSNPGEFNEELLKKFPSVNLIPSDVFVDFEKFFNQEGLHDVIISVENKSIFAHKIILALRSPYFKDQFVNTKMQTLRYENIPYEVMIEMIRFCYNPTELKVGDPLTMDQMLKANETLQIMKLTENINSKLNKFAVKRSLRGLTASAIIQVEMAPGLKNFQNLSDVVFSVGDTKFCLHKMILMSRCLWFEKMLSQNFLEKNQDVITITSMSLPVFKAVIEYLYTGRVAELSPDNCIEVLVASNMLALKRLTQLCEKAMNPLLDADNVIAIYQAAEHYNAPQLMDSCIQIMAYEYLTVKNQENFQTLNENAITRVQKLREQYEQEINAKKMLYQIKLNMLTLLYKKQ